MTDLRIFMPTCDKYLWAANASLRLLDKYWPRHPPIDVVNVPKEKTWVEGALAYLGTAPEFILLMLDDYGLCQTADDAVVNLSLNYIQGEPHVCSVAMTWQPCGTASGPDALFCEFPQWDYSWNTQAAIWRTADFIRILEAIPREASGVWNMEIAGSQFFNHVMYPEGKRMVGWNIPRPADASGFVDGTDKKDWIIAYNNLAHQGKPDPRHTEWLKKELGS